jgi:trimeric autotransporter adhesin
MPLAVTNRGAKCCLNILAVERRFGSAKLAVKEKSQMKLRVCIVATFVSAMACTMIAQTTANNQTSASAQVPRLIKFSGVAKDGSGKSLTGVVGITFSLYKEQQTGTPLWMETQNVQADTTGHYTALLGSATADGVPLELFSSTEAHWIEARISGQPEQPRVLLLSVPYALKAADAETLGGLPVSAFVLSESGIGAGSAAATTSTNAQSNAAGTALAPPGGSGTTNYIPLWKSGTKLGNSVMFQSNGNIGVGTTKPGAGLEADSSAIALLGVSSGTDGVVGATTSTITGAAGVDGYTTGTNGTVYGVIGETSSTGTSAAGVYGNEVAESGVVFGVSGAAASTTNSAAGVAGYESAASGVVYGVAGGTNSVTDDAAGVRGGEGCDQWRCVRCQRRCCQHDQQCCRCSRL